MRPTTRTSTTIAITAIVHTSLNRQRWQPSYMASSRLKVIYGLEMTGEVVMLIAGREASSKDSHLLERIRHRSRGRRLRIWIDHLVLSESLFIRVPSWATTKATRRTIWLRKKLNSRCRVTTNARKAPSIIKTMRWLCAYSQTRNLLSPVKFLIKRTWTWMSLR